MNLEQRIRILEKKLLEAKGKKTSDIFKKTIKYLTNKPFIYFDEKTKTLKKTEADFVVTWQHYEKGHGKPTSQKEIQADKDNIKRRALGDGNFWLDQFTDAYEKEFGKDNFNVEFIEEFDEKDIISQSRSGHRGYNYKYIVKVTPK